MKKTDFIAEAYKRSVLLLKQNSFPTGIIACCPLPKAVDRGYASVFGRDAAISTLGMIATRDPELIQSAKESLRTLVKYQATNGQIPKYVKPEEGEVDFWYTGCIDATLWWLLAVHYYDYFLPQDELTVELAEAVHRALRWLHSQEHQGLFLLQQNEASDWADIMPRSGFVLYTNALWYQVKKFYKIPTAPETKEFFNELFYPFDRPLSSHRRVRTLTQYILNDTKPGDFYLSFVNFSFWGEDIDVFGNILSALFDLPNPPDIPEMVDAMLELKINHPHPVRVIHKPIRKNSPLWREYMNRHLQNLPYQYHNGGIWPFVGGFWVMLLAKTGRDELARQELARLAEVNRINEWEFNEWFHGKTGKPMGMPGQSWNAAMFIVAYHALEHGLKL